jgi:hypothetical protein
VSYGPRPRLLAELSSGAAICSSALDLTSPAEVGFDAVTCHVAPASASPRGDFRRCHVFLNSGPHLPVEVGSGAVMWPRPRLPERRAPVLPCTPWPQRAVNHRNKERSSCPRHIDGLVCVQSTVPCYRGACKACGHVATVQFNSATLVQLTTPRHDYSGDTIRYDGTTVLTMFSIAG